MIGCVAWAELFLLGVHIEEVAAGIVSWGLFFTNDSTESAEVGALVVDIFLEWVFLIVAPLMVVVLEIDVFPELFLLTVCIEWVAAGMVPRELFFTNDPTGSADMETLSVDVFPVGVFPISMSLMLSGFRMYGLSLYWTGDSRGSLEGDRISKHVESTRYSLSEPWLDVTSLVQRFELLGLVWISPPFKELLAEVYFEDEDMLRMGHVPTFFRYSNINSALGIVASSCTICEVFKPASSFALSILNIISVQFARLWQLECSSIW
jgi:hypothetical protein